ncbi:MAG: hypothetical protein ACRDRJ_28185 [Streptosporangiaceae bacterium]
MRGQWGAAPGGRGPRADDHDPKSLRYQFDTEHAGGSHGKSHTILTSSITSRSRSGSTYSVGCPPSADIVSSGPGLLPNWLRPYCR